MVVVPAVTEHSLIPQLMESFHNFGKHCPQQCADGFEQCRSSLVMKQCFANATANIIAICIAGKSNHGSDTLAAHAAHSLYLHKAEH